MRPFDRAWWGALSRSRYVLGVGYAVAATITAAGVLLASNGSAGQVGPTANAVIGVLGLNLFLILALGALMIGRLVRQLAVQPGDAGARLHLRFVTLFSAAAVAPAVIVALFFGVLVTRGVESWFSARVQTVVENSATVARSYVEEQTDYIRDHTSLMAAEVNRAAPAMAQSPVAFSHFLASTAADNGFAAAYLIDRDGRVLARAESAGSPAFLAPPPNSFEAADEGIISAQPFDTADLFRALYRLTDYPDAYLYIVRPVDRGILAHLRETEASLVAYREAADSRARIQTAFALSYAETALLVLVGAVWLGVAAANSIASPVARVVQAAGRVAGGDLSARVYEHEGPAELAVLSRAFNQMTGDLQRQQADLKAANLDAEQRREFIETVLGGVSAGVMGLNGDDRVSAINARAETLLDLKGGLGRPLADAAPELQAVVERAVATGNDAEDEVDVVRGTETRRLRVRASHSAEGLILTFDDITRLLAAQRNAAWKDVARRIAHEIKNPLTPIQLSAERLRRKYRKEISSDLETFDRCTDTIIRQVGDIGRMVDEFSSFARMPAPKFAPADPAELLRQTVFAQRVASPDLTVELEDPAGEMTLNIDARMVGQALANLLKNAAEATSARLHAEPEPPGRIVARLVQGPAGIDLEVEDNGLGLPTRDRDRLTEPYVTTREKGTGLGLAIVKRIMEDHGGVLLLTDAREGRGALAILRFPYSAAAPAVLEAAAAS